MGEDRKDKFKQAIENNLNFRTEYGAGVRLLGGLMKRRSLKRNRYWLDGRREEDDIHEWVWDIGPVQVMRRSRNPKLFSDDDYMLSMSLFRLFVISNEKDLLVSLKAGPHMRVLKLLLAATPASVVTEAVDLDLAARAGVRLNLSRLIRELKSEETDPDAGLTELDRDLD